MNRMLREGRGAVWAPRLLGLFGLAYVVEKSGLGPWETARVLIDRTGRVVVHTGVPSVGQGVETIFAQVCADVLGVRYEDVTVRWGDTDALPDGFGAFASRGTVMGANAVVQAAERVRDPARNVVRATLTGLAVTGVLYLVVCSSIVLALPQETLEAANAPLAYFIEHYWGHGAGQAVAAFTVIAAVGALNGWVLVQGEVPLGMARAGVLPAWVGRTNSRDVPVAALLVASGAASILLLVNASGTAGGLMNFMLNLTAAASLWLYIGACFSAIILGSTRIAAFVGLGFAMWAMVGSGFEAAGLSVVLMLTAVPLYFLALRRAPAK